MSRLQPRLLLTALALAMATTSASASEVPPSDAKPLSQILDAVETSHPGVIVSAELDDRRWEVLSCAADGGNCREFYVDPRSAAILRDKRETHSDPLPPVGGKTAAQIVRSIEERRLGTIVEVEFEHPVWEVALRGSGVRAKLHVDPASGEIQRCRGRGCPAR